MIKIYITKKIIAVESEERPLIRFYSHLISALDQLDGIDLSGLKRLSILGGYINEDDLAGIFTKTPALVILRLLDFPNFNPSILGNITVPGPLEKIIVNLLGSERIEYQLGHA